MLVKVLWFETSNQFKFLENVLKEQSNNNELNMVHETNNPRNDPTMTAEKSVEKLPSSTEPADNNFVSSDVDICINNIRRSEKKNAKKTTHPYWSWQVSDGDKRDVLVSGIINKVGDYNVKVQKVNEFLFEIRTRKNVKYADNGNIGLGMLNRSKLHLNRFGTIPTG